MGRAVGRLEGAKFVVDAPPGFELDSGVTHRVRGDDLPTTLGNQWRTEAHRVGSELVQFRGGRQFQALVPISPADREGYGARLPATWPRRNCSSCVKR